MKAFIDKLVNFILFSSPTHMPASVQSMTELNEISCVERYSTAAVHGMQYDLLSYLHALTYPGCHANSIKPYLEILSPRGRMTYF